MNVIGERMKVLTSSDPTKAGRTGLVVLETANTLLLESEGRKLTVEKSGAAFMLVSDGTVLTGSDLAGRLQDRMGKNRR